MLFYCGSYAEKENGIYLGYLDPHTGKIQIANSFDAGVNPAYIIYNKDHGLIYTLNEWIPSIEKSCISTLKVSSNGMLTLTHQLELPGLGACHGLIHPNGRVLLTADYHSGSITRIDLDEQGIPQKASLQVKHQGKGFNAERQEAPHVHSLLCMENRILAADLGLDALFHYPMDVNQRPYEAVEQWKFPNGSGPRWMLPLGENHLYVVEELSSRINCWYRSEDKWISIQGLSTLPPSYKEFNLPSHLEYHRGHNLLYVSNRGHDSIASFYVDSDTGLIEPAGFTSLEKAAYPRYFKISPCGNFLLVAGQNGNCLESLKLDKKGFPQPTGESVEVQSPSCIKFLKV